MGGWDLSRYGSCSNLPVLWAEEGEKQNANKILATSDMHGYIMPTSYSEKRWICLLEPQKQQPC